MKNKKVIIISIVLMAAVSLLMTVQRRILTTILTTPQIYDLLKQYPRQNRILDERSTSKCIKH